MKHKQFNLKSLDSAIQQTTQQAEEMLQNESVNEPSQTHQSDVPKVKDEISSQFDEIKEDKHDDVEWFIEDVFGRMYDELFDMSYVPQSYAECVLNLNRVVLASDTKIATREEFIETIKRIVMMSEIEQQPVFEMRQERLQQMNEMNEERSEVEKSYQDEMEAYIQQQIEELRLQYQTEFPDDTEDRLAKFDEMFEEKMASFDAQLSSEQQKLVEVISSNALRVNRPPIKNILIYYLQKVALQAFDTEFTQRQATQQPVQQTIIVQQVEPPKNDEGVNEQEESQDAFEEQENEGSEYAADEDSEETDYETEEGSDEDVESSSEETEENEEEEAGSSAQETEYDENADEEESEEDSTLIGIPIPGYEESDGEYDSDNEYDTHDEYNNEYGSEYDNDVDHDDSADSQEPWLTTDYTEETEEANETNEAEETEELSDEEKARFAAAQEFLESSQAEEDEIDDLDHLFNQDQMIDNTDFDEDVNERDEMAKIDLESLEEFEELDAQDEYEMVVENADKKQKTSPLEFLKGMGSGLWIGVTVAILLLLLIPVILLGKSMLSGEKKPQPADSQQSYEEVTEYQGFKVGDQVKVSAKGKIFEVTIARFVKEGAIAYNADNEEFIITYTQLDSYASQTGSNQSQYTKTESSGASNETSIPAESTQSEQSSETQPTESTGK